MVAGSDDPLTQFRLVFSRIGQILEQAGSGLDHVVDITTYHLDMHAHVGDFITAKNTKPQRNATRLKARMDVSIASALTRSTNGAAPGGS